MNEYGHLFIVLIKTDLEKRHLKKKMVLILILYKCQQSALEKAKSAICLREILLTSYFTI